MKALVKTQRGEHRPSYMDVPEPQIGSNELKIKVHAGGLCASDLHILHDAYPCRPPVTMGHEFSGIVTEAGSGVLDFAPGDRVVSLTAISTCEHCEFCYSGLRMLCQERLSIGSGLDGGFAEYIKIPANMAFHIPDNVSLDAAVLCEPLACAVRGVIERTTIRGGDMVLISGAGIIGQLCAQLARICGGIVTVAGTNADWERLKLAKKLGAYATINIEAENFTEAVKRLTKGHGFDVSLECAGAPQSADNCLKALRKTGNFTQIGLFGKPAAFDFDLALLKEVNISNSYASERTSWERALRLLEYGMVDVESLVGSRIKLKNWKEGLRRLEDKLDFKVLLVP